MEQKTNSVSKRGFTLIELLVVIGILAVLTAAVVVVLNPAELLAQSRDTQRFADFDAVRGAVALYLSVATTTSFTAGPFSTNGTDGYSLGVAATRDDYRIDGNGWVAIDFTQMSNPSSPITALPRDPLNNATYHYAYEANDTAKTFELNANLESNKYTPKEGTDGGNSSSYYEVGSDPGLDL